MKQESSGFPFPALEALSWGTLKLRSHPPHSQDEKSFLSHFSVKTQGRGILETYSLFPGAQAIYLLFQGQEITVHHLPSPSTLEVFHCNQGRTGWNMPGGQSVYLGPGDLTVHSSVFCADSLMTFPLGVGEGISFVFNWDLLREESPSLLQEAGLDFARMAELFSSRPPLALTAGDSLEGIFSPLYTAPPSQRGAYLKLKALELLLFLWNWQPGSPSLSPYPSAQAQLIEKIHGQLTEHLEERFTIDQLSRQYSINTSTLKEVFKGVYGMPIASYMKEYRCRQAMKLLRNSQASIQEVARQVGYESQGKFSKAFKEVTGMLPTEYRHRQEER